MPLPPEPPAELPPTGQSLDQLLLAMVGELRSLRSDLAAAPPALMSPIEAARMLGISVSLFHSLVAGGRIGPVAIELSDRCPRYSRAELQEWIAAGSPPRSRWQLIRVTGTPARRRA